MCMHLHHAQYNLLEDDTYELHLHLVLHHQLQEVVDAPTCKELHHDEDLPILAKAIEHLADVLPLALLHLHRTYQRCDVLLIHNVDHLQCNDTSRSTV